MIPVSNEYIFVYVFLSTFVDQKTYQNCESLRLTTPSPYPFQTGLEKSKSVADLSGLNAQVISEKVSVVSRRRVVVRFSGVGSDGKLCGGGGGNDDNSGGAVVGRTLGTAGGGSITRLTLPSKVRVCNMRGCSAFTCIDPYLLVPPLPQWGRE